MKKMILAFTTLAIGAGGLQTASAGGCHTSCGWSTAGQVLAGVTAGLVVGSALAPRPAYYVAPAPVAYAVPGYGYTYAPAAPRAVVYAPPARVVYAAPAPVMVVPPPVYVAPPVVSFSFGYYKGCAPRHYRGGCR